MRHVRITPLPDGYGYNLDPQPYRDALPGLLDALPRGAALRGGPGALRLHGPRCVKDLTLARSTLTDSEGTLTLDLAFAPNEWKHPDALHLRYADVRAFRPDADEPDGLLPGWAPCNSTNSSRTGRASPMNWPSSAAP